MYPIDETPLASDGKIVILAYDHGIEHGPADFTGMLERADPRPVFEAATHPAVTSLAVQKGLAEGYYPSYEDDVDLLVKLNGTSNLWMGEPDTAVNCSVDYANEIGASSVGFTIYAGANNEIGMAEEFREAQESAREHDLPVVLWGYPRGQGIKNASKPEVIQYAARLGLELGADVTKVKYPGSESAMADVVRMAADSKVVMSGGSKTTDRAFLEDVRATMDVGGDGVAVGRNVWQHEDPSAILDALEAIVFEDATVDTALTNAGLEEDARDE
ncbi:aldolase [Natronococcus sp. A-GB7]|uniref:class I fructose-bisphosphate aldolase n=1 Tax=Natronococcus sp. A-GB7 TaxID=3037649 RepID=UPI00241F8EF9|nr:aldolase [Natronococcus sp. A-GB7]MDG5818402.1 aldolase [Natronococcus sp. A-GB7]